MRSTTFVAAALAATAQAAKDVRTFAVLRFLGNGPLMEGRVDPIVSPGKTSGHVHTFQGGSNIGISATGEDMMKSNCSSALVAGDNSGYWMPKVYFRDPASGLLEAVELDYMNVYYFFEPTDDDVVPFPVGLQMVSGDASLRECPNFGGESVLDAGSPNGTQPLQWTCPRTNYDLAAWPAASQSDGTTAGIADPVNRGAGQGFPFSECDGQYSPLRHDLHFPSCYDPSKALTDYQNNMAFPTVNTATGKQNCPAGWLHVPHLFYEMYWNTPAFAGRWTPGRGAQPFLLANGDLSGCSGHGDFLAAWDAAALANVIDNCNAGDAGMDTCPGVTVRDRDAACTVASPIDEAVTGNLTALPGSNALAGWGLSYGGASPAASDSPAAAPAPAVATATTTPAVAVATASASSAPAASSSASPAEEAGDGGESSTMPDDAGPSALLAQQPTAAITPPVVADAAAAAAASSSTATTLLTTKKTKCVNTVTVTVTAGAAADGTLAAAAKRDARAHAHAHAHAARHGSPHHHG